MTRETYSDAFESTRRGPIGLVVFGSYAILVNSSFVSTIYRLMLINFISTNRPLDLTSKLIVGNAVTPVLAFLFCRHA